MATSAPHVQYCILTAFNVQASFEARFSLRSGTSNQTSISAQLRRPSLLCSAMASERGRILPCIALSKHFLPLLDSRQSGVCTLPRNPPTHRREALSAARQPTLRCARVTFHVFRGTPSAIGRLHDRPATTTSTALKTPPAQVYPSAVGGIHLYSRPR